MKGECLVKEIQMKNFRSLKDTGMQKLSPITILVGENSSGKSTFLRAFPLLKQSISKHTSGPILWAGDVDDYVDFGSFKETVTNDKSKEITFAFKFDVSDIGLEYGFFSLNYFLDEKKKTSTSDKQVVHYVMTLKSIRSNDVVTNLSLSIGETQIDFALREKVIRTCGGYVYKESAKKPVKANDPKHRSLFGRVSARSKTFGYWLPDIGTLLDKVFAKWVNPENDDFEAYYYSQMAAEIGEKLANAKPIDMLDEKKRNHFPDGYVETYNGIVSTLNKTDHSDLHEILKICFFYKAFRYIDEYLSDYFRQVHYIAPVRATAERYYRLRNLAVDEVDFQGKNLAIFINSLSKKKLDEFQAWTNKHFGFAVNVKQIGGHLSLQIKLSDSNQEINLSDTGFGYSQILPIITQLWELSTHERTYQKNYSGIPQNIPLVIAIEQPELHLHPAIQAKLAKAFIASIDLARSNGYELQLILETHSQTIVNYFGRSIARGQLKADDISLILFEKKPGENLTTVHKSYYDNDGYLNDWPYGFFDSED